MRWLVIILALIGLTSIADAAPTGSSIAIENLQTEPVSSDTTTTSSSSSSSSSALSLARKLPTHDVGLPSELAWQAWLVVASKPDAQSSFESATVPRRIGPKSVFVAPALQTACSDGYTSDVMGRCIKETINIDPQTHLAFIRDRLRAKYSSPVQSDDSSATSSKREESPASSGPLQVNISLGIEDNLSASRSPSPSVKSERDADSGEPGSESESVEISVLHVPGVGPSRDIRKPLTAYEVGTGEGKEGTFFRKNSSQPLRDDEEAVLPVAEFVDDGNQTFTEVIDYEAPLALGNLFNDSDSRPSPSVENFNDTKPEDDTQQPKVVLLLSPKKTTTTGTSDYRVLVRTENTMGVDAGIAVNNTELIDSPSDDTTTENDQEVTVYDDEVEGTTTPGVSDALPTTFYPEEDLDYATESYDEILAHGEAGMLVSAGKLEDSFDEIPKSKTPDETGGNISSESNISGDVILETTLLDLNTESSPKHDDLRELFEAEKDLGLEPEVLFSPQDARRIDRPNTRGKNRGEDLTASSSTPKESVLTDPNDSNPSETSHREEHNESGNLQQRRITTSSLQDYVRFPDDQSQDSSGYVLFPSDRSNSVHSGNVNSYKERISEITRPQLAPKSSVPLHQKKTYWHLPAGWRIDDLQPHRQTVPVQNANQRLFRFWTRMPLFRDPSLSMSNQSSRVSPIVNEREGIYRSISPEVQAVNRGFVQTTRGGGQVIG